MTSRLSHSDGQGRVRMVDVGKKKTTRREATAAVNVTLKASTFRLLKAGALKKGDVLAIAEIAGIQAAKRTAELIPLCHPLPISFVGIKLTLNNVTCGVEIVATCRTNAETGVEMEAMTAAAVAALTVYDMCKSVERGICITDLRLLKKSGGKSGTWKANKSGR